MENSASAYHSATAKLSDLRSIKLVFPAFGIKKLGPDREALPPVPNPKLYRTKNEAQKHFLHLSLLLFSVSEPFAGTFSMAFSASFGTDGVAWD